MPNAYGYRTRISSCIRSSWTLTRKRWTPAARVIRWPRTDWRTCSRAVCCSSTTRVTAVSMPSPMSRCSTSRISSRWRTRTRLSGCLWPVTSRNAMPANVVLPSRRYSTRAAVRSASCLQRAPCMRSRTPTSTALSVRRCLRTRPLSVTRLRSAEHSQQERTHWITTITNWPMSCWAIPL